MPIFVVPVYDATIERSLQSSDDSTPARIRAAALDLFASKGFAATGIRDLAAKSGVSSSSLYHHFDTKENLLFRLMTDSLSSLLEAVRLVTMGLREPEQQLVALAKFHTAVHGSRDVEARVMDNEMRSLPEHLTGPILQLRDSYEHEWNRTLQLGLAEGVFTFGDASLTRLALVRMCAGVHDWYSADGPRSLEEIMAHYAEFALRLVDARRDGQSLHAADFDVPGSERIFEAIATAYGP